MNNVVYLKMDYKASARRCSKCDVNLEMASKKVDVIQYVCPICSEEYYLSDGLEFSDEFIDPRRTCPCRHPHCVKQNSGEWRLAKNRREYLVDLHCICDGECSGRKITVIL